MKTNKFFSFSRLGLLLRNDMLINYKKYSLGILGAFFAGFVIFYLSMPKEGGFEPYIRVNSYSFDYVRYWMFFVMFMFALGAFIGMAFPMMTNKVKTSAYLLFPASTFEKFLSQFLVHFVGGTVVFLVLFYLDAHLARTAVLAMFKGDSTWAIEPFSYLNMIRKISGQGDSHHLIMVFFVVSVVSVGAYLFSVRLFFSKYGLAKTLISIALLVFFAVCTMVVFSHIFFAKETYGFDINIPDYTFNLNLFGESTYSIKNLLAFVIMTLSWIFFLPLGYFKLKEKEL